MIWRERGSGGGGLRRRPAVNNVDTGISDSPLDLSKFCPKCNFSLSYLKDLDIWVCKCGWGVPKELLLHSPLPPQSSNNKKTTDEEEPVIMGGRNNPHSSVIRSSEEEKNSIPIASKPLRSAELANRVKRLPGEDRDTAMLQEKGYTLIDSSEYQATGDVDTISSDDLFFDNPTSGVRRRYSKKW